MFIFSLTRWLYLKYSPIGIFTFHRKSILKLCMGVEIGKWKVNMIKSRKVQLCSICTNISTVISHRQTTWYKLIQQLGPRIWKIKQMCELKIIRCKTTRPPNSGTHKKNCRIWENVSNIRRKIKMFTLLSSFYIAFMSARLTLNILMRKALVNFRTYTIINSKINSGSIGPKA